MDDEFEDEVLSEDDDEAEDEFLSEDDGDDWRPTLLHPNVNHHHNTHVSECEQGKRPEDSEFHPTPEDIALVRSSLPLPPELVTQILDLAGYWALSRATRSDPTCSTFRDANARFLRSSPIQGGEFTHPLRRVVITTDSKDQGWSSYRETQGTREGSWTWFELSLDDGGADYEMARVEIVRNIHAGQRFEKYRAVIEDERILKQAKKGDRLSVWVRAMYPGWVNSVQSVEIEIWSAC